MEPVVLEAGPTTVRRLGDSRGAARESARAALDGIDDPVVLLDELPVGVSDLWRRVLGSALGPNPGDVLIVHPSWWTRARVDRVVAAASGVCDSVAAIPRAAFVARRIGRPVVVVEIDAERVAVGTGRETAVLSLPDPRAVADLVVRIAGDRGAAVVLDSPPDLAGGIREVLADRGIATRLLDIDALVTTPSPATPIPAASNRRRKAAAAAAVLSGAVLSVGLVLQARPAPRSDPAPTAARPVSLVEGRVTVRIPARWEVARVTGGPGSRRVQVRSPADPDAALHLTQSYAPESSLAEAEDVLAKAVAGQPQGVFAGLSGTSVAGRDVLTYREIRPGRVIRWLVLIDGATRIAIGCQSAPGREESIAAACDEAVVSARETDGNRNRPGAVQ